MTTEVLELVVRVSGAGTGGAELDRMAKSASGLTSALRFMRNALVALSFGRAALGIVDLLDSFVTMQNKLTLVTRNINEVNVATEALAQIAIRSRSPLDATTTLFTRMARSLTNLHLTYGELLDITEATNKALIISGATTDEARNAIVQFTQGLALGVLRGQDLRSVVEFAPRLAQVLADGLSKSTTVIKQFGEGFKLAGGQLYSFVTAHKNILTSQIVIEAYKDALAKLNIEFDKTKPTIQQAFTNLSTAVEIFIGRASAANGVVGHLVEALDFVREHLNAFAEGLAVLAGIFVFRLLVTEVLRFGTAVFGVARLLVSAFTGLGAVIARVGLSGSLFLRSFIGLTLVVGAVYGIIAAFQYFGITLNDVLDFFERFIASVISILQVMAKLFGAIWDSFVEGAVNSFNFISTKFTEFLNHFREEQKKPFTISAGTSEGGGDRLAAFFDGREMKANAGLFEKNLATVKKTVGDIQSYFDNLGKGGVGKEAIDAFRQLQAALSGTSKNIAITAEDSERARASLLDFIRQVSPYAAAKAKIADLDAKIAQAAKKGVDADEVFASVQLTKVEIQRRLTREVIGVGNATTDYAERLHSLSDALKAGAIDQEEFGEQSRIARIKLLGDGRDIASGIGLSVEKLTDLLSHKEKIAESAVDAANAQAKADAVFAISEDALSQAVARGNITQEKRLEVLRQQNIARLELDRGSASKGVEVAKLKIGDELSNVNKITADVTTQALGTQTAFQLLEVQTQGLNTALASGAISAADYERVLRDLQITALGTKTDALSGYQKGLLEVQKSISDIASQTSQLVTGAFSNMTDALVNFAQTGKLNLKSLFDSIISGLLRIAIQQQIMAPLAQSLGLSAGVGSGAPGGGAASWGGGANGIGSLLGSFATTANGNVGSGVFGAISDFGSFLGFANEGQFRVGGQGGTDSQMVAFRASPDETVSVTKPGRSAQDHTQVVHVHVYGATNPNDFKASEGQVAAAAGGAMRRAQSRNGRN